MHDNNFLNKVKTLAGNYFSLTPYIISQQDAEASIAREFRSAARI